MFTGLHPGAAIEVRGRIDEFGAVACILGSDGIATHLLTAGHLFAADQSRVAVVSGRQGSRPSVVGHLAVNLLDLPFLSMPHPIDVALVELTPEGVELAAPVDNGPSLSGYIATAELLGIEVAAFRATSHDYSQTTTTLEHRVDVLLESPVRGTYSVREGVGTSVVITSRGDSGTIVFNGPPASAAAIGLCVGEFDNMTVIEPLARALTVLGNETGLILELL